MEATLAPAAPIAQTDFRTQLHQVIDQIQDEAVLRAALLLLQPQVVAATEPAPAEDVEPELSPAWQQRLELGIQQLDAGQGIPFAEVMARLQAETAA